MLTAQQCLQMADAVKSAFAACIERFTSTLSFKLGSYFNDEYLNRKQAARFLKLSVTTLEKWFNKGIGPRPYRVGRRLLYKRTELILFIEGNPRIIDD